MTQRRVLALLAFVVSYVAAASCFDAPARAADDAAIARGAYLAVAGGCESCHTDKKNNGAPLAGGRALVTPFGTFYGPNITPDPKTGIGDWTEDQFKRALRSGIDDEGHYLYPVFPFTTFTNITDADAGDLFAYLKSVKPVEHEVPPDTIKFPFGWRPLLFFWRTLFFKEGPLPPASAPSNTPSDV